MKKARPTPWKKTFFENTCTEETTRGILNGDDGIYYVEHTFTCIEKPVQQSADDFQNIDRIDFTGAAPVEGQKPNYSISMASALQCSIDTDYNESGFKNGVRWQNMNSTDFLSANDTFQKGVPYRVNVMMKAAPGYAVKFGANGAAATVITFNGTAGGQCQGETDFATDFMVSFDFGQRHDEEEEITTVALTGPVPKVGQKPSYDVKVADDAPYYINQAINEDAYVKGVAWFRVEDLSFVMPNETFKAGYTYRILVNLDAKPGYVFKCNEIDEDYYETDVTPTYNGAKGWFGSISPYQAHVGWETVFTASIGDVKVSGFKRTMNYTGRAVKQNMKLYFNGLGIFEGEDYTLTYKNNTKLGTASVTVKGIGRYTGSVTLKYTIVLAKPKLTVSKVTANSVTLKWGKVTGAKYYTVYQYNKSTKKYTVIFFKTTGTSYTHKNRKPGTTYYYLVRAYGTDASGKTVGSNYTVNDCVKAITLCKAPVVVAKVYRTGKTSNIKAVSLGWVKCSGAKYYKVYEYNPGKKSYKTLQKVTGTSVKLGKTTKGTHYYLVRAFNANDEGSAFTTKNHIKVVVK